MFWFACLVSLASADSLPKQPDLIGSSLETLWKGYGERFSKYRSMAMDQTRATTTSNSSTSYTHLKLEMNDGVELTTIVAIPYPYDQKRGTVICRSPYGPNSEYQATIYNYYGFAAVMQDDRGTWTSGGKFNLWRGASEDALRTMQWIVNQSWSDGRVYSVGISADGINEAISVLANPPMMHGQWFQWTTADGHSSIYPGGTYRQGLFEGYLKALSSFTRGASWLDGIDEVRKHEAYSDWWTNLTGCLNASSPDCHFKQVKWPIVNTVGWWDIFQQQQLDMWSDLRIAAPAQYSKSILVVEPLGHCSLAGGMPEVLQNASWDGCIVSETLAGEMFLNYDGPVHARVNRVNLYVMAAADGGTTGNYWTSLPDWPKPTLRNFYMSAASTMSSVPPTGDPLNATYTYYPKRPTPMKGGNNLPFVDGVPGCGSVDILFRDVMSDVVFFDTPPFEEDVAVVGRLTAHLYVSSLANDTDFVVTVSDLTLGTNKSMLVRYGAQRMRWRDGIYPPTIGMEAGKVYAVDVDLWSTAYIFPKGHSLRVSVSSAAAPTFSTNYNTGRNHLVDGWFPKHVDAVNTVHFSTEHPSHISLPVVPLASIPENPSFAYWRQGKTTIAASIFV